MTYKEIFDANNEDLQDILDAVNDLPDAGSGGITPSGTLNITANGTYDVTEYASAVVNVASSDGPGGPSTDEFATIPLNVTKNGTYSAAAYGVDGFTPVVVDVPSGGAAQTCTVVVSNPVGYTMSYLDAAQNVVEDWETNGAITVVKNSTIITWCEEYEVGEGVVVEQDIYDGGRLLVVRVTGDGTLTIG